MYVSESEVLSHGFDFRPEWWMNRVPERWSSFLGSLPDSERGRRYHRITRSDLLDQAQDSSPDGNLSLLVACYAWGTGDSGWLVPRRARVFRDTDPGVLGRKLSDARRLLDDIGPAAAYASLDDGGPNRIKQMRSSFFTKFLYASSASHVSSSGRALILDQFVAIALNDLDGWTLRERGPWSSDTYVQWIELAASVAGAASTRDHPVRPDAVEMAYFTRGRGLSKARRE